MEQLTRKAGRRGSRYVHLFCGEVTAAQEEEPEQPAAYIEIGADIARLDALEQEVERLRLELEQVVSDLRAARDHPSEE